VSGYILDHLALIAGLSAVGTEHQRREVSRLLHGATDGGPRLDVPALCLAAANHARPGIAGHVADLVATARIGAIAVSELARTVQLDALTALRPELDWPATHAAARALATGHLLFTAEPEQYAGVGLEVVPL
jgi:hypothetical protein